MAGAEERLGEVVRRTAARGGKVLIPAFALGRVQEIVYALHQLHRAGRIPAIPIYVDSPLAVDATTVFRMHPEIFDRARAAGQRIVDRCSTSRSLRYVRDVADVQGAQPG